MANPCRIFGLLVYKNLLVRKRHWLMTIIFQGIVPFLFFILVQALRDFSVQAPYVHTENTTYLIETKEDLISHISRGYNYVYYMPKDAYTQEIMNNTRMCLSLPNEKVIGFLSEADLLNAYASLQVESSGADVLAVIFEKYNTTSTKYRIRYNGRIPTSLYDPQFNPRFVFEEYYSQVRFVQLQMCIDESLINNTAPPLTSTAKVSIQHMPYPPYVQTDTGDLMLRMIVCLFAVSAFLMPLCVEANYIAKEKSIGVNALMAINGVKVYQNLLSWLATSVLFSILYVVPVMILFKNTFTGNVIPYLYYSDIFLFWVLVTTHVAHLVAFGMHISAYFPRPVFVIIVLVIFYNAATSLQTFLINEELFTLLSLLGILFPNFLLYRIFEEANAYELKLIGIHWSNMFVPGNINYNVVGSVGFMFLLSIIGAIFHFTLAVYINAVLPGKYGVRQDPFYFLTCIKGNKVSLDDEPSDFDYGAIRDENFEPVARGALIPGIEIRNLKKTYNTGWLRRTAVHALKGISMDLYKGQITALLGHNGAGKTTLMSILTGVTSATTGSVYVNGKSIRTDLDGIRNDLGLCPQENMVFPDLTVYEHLVFFGMLKAENKKKSEIERNVDMLLTKLKISEKRNVLPSKLSGGQKRRLCLGMALIGDASIIVLDEPTSGMDPETRRDTWDIILRMRGEKTILITTHNMEEADILGDRIAIVHAGRLRSYGTAMFLKKRYGHGFIEVTLSTQSWCDPDKVINKFDPRTRKVSVESEKIILNIPHTESLPQSLDAVEREKSKLGVTGISVSLITLEEVFLKIVENEKDGKHLAQVFNTPVQKVAGLELHRQTILALLEKKITYTWRNMSTVLIIVILPIISIFLMSLSDVQPSTSTNIFPLKLDIYRDAEVLYSSNGNTFDKAYKKSIQDFYGIAKPVPQDMSMTDGLLNLGIKNIVKYRNNLIAAAEFNISDDVMYANAFYSTVAIHSLPISLNLLSNALLKGTVGEEYSIEISSQPLPTVAFSGRIGGAMDTAIPKVFIFCCFFFPTVALFLSHPLQETVTKIKQLQRMTGVSSVSYWSTMFIIDLIIYMLTIFIILLVFYISDLVIDSRIYRQTEILTLMLMLFLFGLNSLPITYIFSFMNKSRNTMITILSIAPIGLVIVQYLAHSVLSNFPKLDALYQIQKVLLRLIPHVSLFHSELSFFQTALKNARCRQLPNALREAVCKVNDYCCAMDCMDGECKHPLPYFTNFKYEMSLEECLVYLAATPLLYFAIVFLLEEKVFPRLFAKIFGSQLRNGSITMDEQVKQEKQAVAIEINKINSHATNPGSHVALLETTENENENLFLVYELSKRYGKLVAVREINFRVKQRECFGLLGVNGAGKSTTFRMLTGEEIPNSGTMYLGYSEIQKDRKNYLSQMGYCPQTDALLNSLNSFEHLRLFAMLRGIPRSKVDLEVSKWINRLNLNACMSQPSGTYSGGNKRRLNIAMSLIGNPRLVLLDEPTTGVDPAAKRSLWTTLQSCQAAGQAIILTSHSMEECEALCNRLVIMVRGQLVCVGPSQELKQRFGAGYDIHVKLNPSRSNEDIQNIKREIQSSLTCDVRDENLGYIAYHVTDSQTTWEKMYNTMNNLKTRYDCIEDYAVLSATLEQLFIQFARGAEMPTHVQTATQST